MQKKWQRIRESSKFAQSSLLPFLSESVLNAMFNLFVVIIFEILCTFQMYYFLYRVPLHTRKCHSTTTTLLAIRDDILKAMQSGEVTIAVNIT